MIRLRKVTGPRRTGANGSTEFGRSDTVFDADSLSQFGEHCSADAAHQGRNIGPQVRSYSPRARHASPASRSDLGGNLFDEAGERHLGEPASRPGRSSPVNGCDNGGSALPGLGEWLSGAFLAGGARGFA